MSELQSSAWRKSCPRVELRHVDMMIWYQHLICGHSVQEHWTQTPGPTGDRPQDPLDTDSRTHWTQTPGPTGHRPQDPLDTESKTHCIQTQGPTGLRPQDPDLGSTCVCSIISTVCGTGILQTGMEWTFHEADWLTGRASLLCPWQSFS